MADVKPLKVDTTNGIAAQFGTGDTVAAAHGGTGQSSYTTGDILYASGAAALSKLGIGSTGQVLLVSGGLPAWGTNTGNLDITATNDNAGTIAPGTVVYKKSNGAVDKARADSASTMRVAGFNTASAAAAATATIRTWGLLTLTTGEWDAVAGTTGGLASGTVYYLSGGTAGNITSTVTSTSGQFIVPVCEGISTTAAILFPTRGGGNIIGIAQ